MGALSKSETWRKNVESDLARHSTRRSPDMTPPGMTPLEEQNAFFDAIGKSIHHWANVEHALGMVLCGVLGRYDTCDEDGVILATFYAVENFRSKLSMVDAALRARLDNHPLLEKWIDTPGKKGLMDQVGKASKWRNKFVHFTVASPYNYKPGFIVLVPNINNRYLHTRLGRKVEQYTYADIARNSANWEPLSNLLFAYGSDVRRLRAELAKQT